MGDLYSKKHRGLSLAGKRILVMGSGSGSNFEALVRALRPYGLQFSGLFCDRPGAYIIERARRLGVDVFPLPESQHPSGRLSKKVINDTILQFFDQPFDLVLLAGYMRILPPRVVQPYEGKIINIHPSLLPKYPGLHGIQQAFDAKASRTGVTIHLVNEGVDEGAILAQASLAIREGEMLDALTQRVHHLEHQLYPQAVLDYLYDQATVLPPSSEQMRQAKVQKRKAFVQFLLKHQIVGFFDKPITLKSGRESHWYVNWRKVAEDVHLLDQTAEYLVDFIQDLGLTPDTIYGVPEGATKLAILAQHKWAMLSETYGAGSHVLAMGRAKPKLHGALRDKFFLGVPRGKTLLVEDVTTTGGSLLRTLEDLQKAEVDVMACLSLTDRLELREDGLLVKDKLKQLGVPFYTLSDALEFLPEAIKSASTRESIREIVTKEYEVMRNRGN